MSSVSRSCKSPCKLAKQGKIISFAYSDTGERIVSDQMTEQPGGVLKKKVGIVRCIFMVSLLVLALISRHLLLPW